MIWAAITNEGYAGEPNRIAQDVVTSTGNNVTHGARTAGSRIALLTPYSGQNLGDASIQDAMIVNIRSRLPDVQFSGITLSSDNFVERHGGADAFPLIVIHLRFLDILSYRSRERLAARGTEKERLTKKLQHQAAIWIIKLTNALKIVPILSKILDRITREIRHWVEGYRFLRTHDLLIVSGGGQLNEEWLGAWRFPYGLFKWAVLARLAGVPYVVASVGATKITSPTSRMFISAALSLARYRSYRDKHTKDIATRLLRRAAADPVVPDLAFSLPSAELPPPANIQAMAQHRKIIAISPISYGKPEWWWCPERELYDRYLRELAQVVSELLQRGYYLVIVCSSLIDDESVIPDLLSRLDDESQERLATQLHVPTIETWKDLVATLKDVDLLIASRLHSTILGFMSDTPSIAISSSRKVDLVMEDLGQTDYLLQIRNFTSKDVIDALDRLEPRKDIVLQQIAFYRHQTLSVSALQYDALAELVIAKPPKFAK